VTTSESYNKPIFVSKSGHDTLANCIDTFFGSLVKYHRSEDGAYQAEGDSKWFRGSIYTDGEGHFRWGVYRDYDKEAGVIE
jgi:hypothetical protein